MYKTKEQRKKSGKINFVAVLSIYGVNKTLIKTVFDKFYRYKQNLSKRDYRQIEEYLLNKARIPENAIAFTETRIIDESSHLILD